MKQQPIVMTKKVRLKDFDPADCAGMEKEKTKEKTEDLAKRIGQLQALLAANARHAVLLIFQGMDASGKDGAIRSVLRHVNPAGVETTNFKIPSDEERAHDFLWREHKAVPRYGNIGTFNRSHYEAVLVERVLEIVPKKEWAPRYEQIVDFERMLLKNRVVLLKFCLHISKKEQATRFAERLENPRKYWKFSRADLRMRQRWEDYAQAYEDMLNKTSHPGARWHLIPSDRNWYRDYVIARTVADAIEDLKMHWPRAAEDFSKIRIK